MFLDVYFQKGQQEPLKREEPRSEAVDRIEAAKYEALKKKLTFRQYSYKNSKLRAKLFAYRFLAPLPDIPSSVFPRHQRLQLWIPNTLVYDGESPPFWVFSKDGLVYRIDNFTNTQAINRLGSVNKYELVAVSRIQRYDPSDGRVIGYDVELLNTNMLKERLRSLGCRNERVAIQKFVKSKGKKAFICRCVWSADKPPYCFIITNKKSYDDTSATDYQRCIVNVDDSANTSIVHAVTGSQCEETGRYMKNLVRFMQTHLKVRLLQVVGDFTKDDAGDWYFLSLNAFKEKSQEVPLCLKLFLEADSMSVTLQGTQRKVREHHETSERMATCKLCQMQFPPSQLPHKLTMKMLIQAEKQLRHQGAILGWVSFGDYENYDTSALYQTHKVCETCFELFKSVDKLRKRELELAWRLGILDTPNELESIPEDGEPVINTRRVLRGLNQEATSQDLDEDFSLTKTMDNAKLFKTAGSLAVPLNKNKPKVRYKLLLVFHELVEMSGEFLKAEKITLAYNFLGFEGKVVLKPSNFNKESNSVAINKVRLYYFFANSASDVNHVLKRKDKAKIEFFFDGHTKEPAATTMLDLSDFSSPLVTQKKYYFNCTGSKALCFIKLAIGMHRETKLVDTSRIPMKEPKDEIPIFVPTMHYYTCEPLLPEWIDLIPEF